MKVEANFTQISSSREPLLPDIEYPAKLLRIDDQAEDEEWKVKNATSGKQPAIIFVSEVTEGDRVGAETQEYIYTKTKEGKPNKRGLGQIKSYAEAILGAEKANDPTGIELTELVGGEYIIVMREESYTDTSGPTPVPKKSIKVGKVLPRR